MAALAPFIKLLHVVSAFLVAAGLVARGVSFRRASEATAFAAADALLSLSQWFDRKLVVPWSMVLLVSGLASAHAGGWPMFVAGRPTWVLVAIVLNLSLVPIIALVLAPRSKVRERAAEDARAQGRITAELTRALNDGAVLNARRAEMAILMAVLLLMVLKPAF